MRIRVAGLTLAAALLAGPVAGGQPPVRETVIVTGHASPEPFRNLSRAVSVLTREQIARLPVRSIAEALQYLASVDVQSRGAMGVQADFSVRGAAFGRTLVLVNGVRINDAQSGHHNGDIPVPLDEVERIEVLYGPGSSLYGADAFGGTINIITRRPDRQRRQFSLSAGQFGFVDGAAALSVAGQRAAQGAMHSPAWSESSSSSAVRRAARMSSLSVVTTMPSAAGSAHEGERVRAPSTCTQQR